MVRIDCQPDGSCPYQYSCIDQACVHDPVFPLGGYPIAAYALFPFASAICNLSGNSFGEWKILLLMDVLNYSQSAGTTFCYPLVLGTALYNFITLIPRRHPSKNTSLVDYNIVSIIIPNVLFGSTVGSLLNNFIPPVIADVLIILLLGAFCAKFFFKLRSIIKEQQVKKQEIMQTIVSSQKQQESLLVPNQHSGEHKAQLQKQIQYESGYHWPHIAAVILLFTAFELCSFLAQGKIIHFTFCTRWYVIGVSILTLLYAATVFGVYRFTKNKMNYYKQIGYHYQYPLEKIRFYGAICMGSFLGGFNGGTFALGNSTSIIFTLIFLGIEPIVVSATVGFQLVFSAAASVCQAVIIDSIPLEVIGLFFGITFIFGGILSYLLAKWISQFNRSKINKILVLIVGCLTGMSAVSMIINIIISYNTFGADYMISIDDICA